MADSANGYRGLVATVTVADGVVRPLETPVDWWYVDRVVWMPDGASLVASIAVDTLGDLELWRVAYPSGATTRLTSDLNSYEGVTAAKDGTLAAVQTSIRQTLWVSTEADASDAHPISTGIEPYLGASWTPDGRVLYSSRRSGNFEVYLSDAAGQQPRQLTFDKAVDRDPVMAPDGRTVFFASNRDGPFHIWKVSIDATSAPQRVTSGGDDEYPAVSPDGQWLVYQGLDPAKLSASICTMRLDATSPTIVSQGYANWPAISPDGRWIAYVQQAASDEHVKGAVIAVAGDSAPKKFEVPILSMPRRNYQRLRWSADSRNVLYIDDTGGVSQVWSMTPGAENRTRLTAFPSDRIFTIDARNGSLLMVRGSVTSDVVVIASAS